MINYTNNERKNPYKFLYISIWIFKTKLYVRYLLPWYIRYNECGYTRIIVCNLYDYHQNQH